MARSVHVVIAGRVQGVGYRAWCDSEARSRRLTGWVRNRADGSVEAVFVGPGDAVAAMVDALWKGPPGAKVTHVSERLSAERPEAFSILPTV